MNATTKRHYLKLRKAGYRPMEAARNAAIKAQFERLEDCGLVQIAAMPDEFSSYDDLAGECYAEFNYDSAPGGERAVKAQEKEFKAQIEREGVYGCVGQYRLSEDDEWTTADSVWGFVGTDFHGYEFDAMHATIEALKTALMDRYSASARKRKLRIA